MLILAEKPSVAAAFAQALGVQKKGGFWENDEYCIVNALGHLLENYDPEDYDPALKKWSLESLPFIPNKIRFKAVKNTKAQLDLVKKCFDRHMNDPFLLATDAEREGELIGAEILDYAGFRNYQTARRFWVSAALTDEVVREGVKNAKPLADYASYKEQGYARQAADWLAGMNITRLISLKSGKTLHFGRVQTAVLAAVYDREKSIAGFTPEKYVEVTALLDAGKSLPLKLRNPQNDEFPSRFPPDAPVLKDIEAKKEMLTSAEITDLKKDKKSVHPPQLFNLTALQKEASRKFSYSPEQTLSIAQALYEKHKCLSYPRTPSRVMGDENVDLVRDIYNRLHEYYAEWSSGSDPAFISPDNKRVFNSKELEDHHALIPLAPLPDGEAAPEEENVFNLVLKQFFNVFKSDYIYNAVTITADIKGFAFFGNAVEIVQLGWKDVGDDDGDDEKKEEKDPDFDPEITTNAEYPVSSITPVEKFTEPKKHYTFASLLQLMENPRGDDGRHLAGLGTPATRGNILKKLFDRGYLVLKGKNILISDDGVFLIDNIRKNEVLSAFISISETTRWEEQLHQDTGKFLQEIKNFVRNAVADTSMTIFQQARKSLGKCPLCGGEVFEGKQNYYCGNYKEKGCHFAVWKEICQASVSAQDAEILLAGKDTKPKKCKSKAGKEFQARFYLDKGKVTMRFEDRKK
jgi:DNA topoisomerase-3